MKNLRYTVLLTVLFLPAACNEKGGKAHHTEDTISHTASRYTGYTCPMHPQVHSDTAGTCPICGMRLEPVKSSGNEKEVSLNTLLKPANQQVIAAVPMVHMTGRAEDIEMTAYGFVTYDPRQSGTISANISGRIEKLYVRYRYQPIGRGQRVMDIYSPELLTAQENLLFLLKNDPDNKRLVDAAKQKLLLLGMSTRQLQQVIQSGKPAYAVTLYSRYSGHIYESTGNSNEPAVRETLSTVTSELSLKEGMYVQKGQAVFSVNDHAKAWALLNIFAGQEAIVKAGDKVRITPETAPRKDFRASVNFIEPFYRAGSKTLTARVYFDNGSLRVPIGSQVKATIFAGRRQANWLPEEAVLSLGLEKVVFVREGESFKARKISTGIINKHLVQVLNGLAENEAVAANAQYLVDSESFIKTNQ
jgi:Cu(I)/Ag(I) efflux system membrane fusion protein